LKGHTNIIQIDRERYHKHTIIDLNTPNEPSSTDFPVLGNYSCDSGFGNFTPHVSNIPPTRQSKMIFQVYLLAATEGGILCQDSRSGVADKEDDSGKITRHEGVSNSPPKFGHCTLIVLNHKKGQEQDASSLTLSGNETSYPVD